MANTIETKDGRTNIVLEHENGFSTGLFVEETTVIGTETKALCIGDYSRAEDPGLPQKFTEHRQRLRGVTVETVKDLIGVLQSWVTKQEMPF